MAKKKVIEWDRDIFNRDIIHYFKTGESINMNNASEYDEECNVIDNVLYFCSQPMAIKLANGDILFNGDENSNESLLDEFDEAITTSLTALGFAKVNLSKLVIVESADDEEETVGLSSDDWDDFEENMPSGATYFEYKGHNVDDNGNITGEIIEKRWHRAGCLLLKSEGKSYICGQDNDSYFVSKLETNPKTIDEAFMSLKPKRVIQYENKTGKQAWRQGEWFFIPTDGMEATNMKKKALPVSNKQGNKHVVSRYEKCSNGRHYCKGIVEHTEHSRLELGNVLHEAICNTALGSWSVKGVD